MKQQYRDRASQRRAECRVKVASSRLLRTLHGRVCATDDDRLFLVPGTPNAQKLVAAMASSWPFTRLADRTVLEHAGFRRGDMREVTPQELMRIGRALRLLRKNSTLRGTDALQQHERRLQEIEGWYRRLQEGERVCQHPLWLSKSEDRDIHKRVSDVLRGGYLPAVAELARSIVWLSDIDAMQRFLTCLAPHIPKREVWAERHDWKRLLSDVQAIRKRFPTSAKRERSGVRLALESALSRLPEEFRAGHNITPPSQDVFALPTLEGLLKRSRAEVDRGIEPPSRRMMAALAALCSVDGTRVPPASGIFKSASETDLPQ